MMDITQKITALNKLLEKSEDVRVENSSDPDFKSWKNLCERTFVKIFGEKSTEFKQFKSLNFRFNPGIWMANTDYSNDHLMSFRRDLKILMNTIKSLIEELTETVEDKVSNEMISPNNNHYEKIFISHSSMDKEIVEELIDILNAMGVSHSQIFCSSFSGYGVPLGSDFLNTIKREINKNVLILFVLSNNFYSSPACLCEMGATWVLSKEHIPVIIPPFTFEQIKGVIPLTQGLLINDKLQLNLLQETIVNKFCVNSQVSSVWERKRDRAIERINRINSI